MKVDHLSTYLNGGAAIAARRLHDSLINLKIDSNFFYSQAIPAFCQETVPPDRTYIPLYKNTSHIAKFYRAIRRRLYPIGAIRAMNTRRLGYERFRSPILYNKSSISMLSHMPNILQLHWIYEFLDHPSFFASVPDALPIVWTLHDMTPFTGGCNYNWNCQHFKTVCHDCPQLNINSSNDFARKCFEVKRYAIKNKNIHVVANSTLIESEARQSPIFSNVKSFQTIHYGLDIGIFKPKEKTAARKELNIESNKTILSFGAVSLSNKRKGMKEFISAIRKLENKEHMRINKMLSVIFLILFFIKFCSIIIYESSSISLHLKFRYSLIKYCRNQDFSNFAKRFGGTFIRRILLCMPVWIIYVNYVNSFYAY